jgi:hypothetical protein
MKKILYTALLTLSVTFAHTQTHCTRAKVFVAEMNMSLGLERTGVPMFSGGVGVSGIYDKGTILDNMTAILGAKSIVVSDPGKPFNERLTMLPTATIMYRLRLNGEDSRTIHAFAWVTGKNYNGFDYRAYMAHTDRSFAVIGGIVGWNNNTGWNVGLAVLGLW